MVASMSLPTLLVSLNPGEIGILLVLVLIVIGPQRMPHYAQQLGRLVRKGRDFAQDAKAQVEAEIGPEIKDVDWKQYDPREYDPRKIVRDALAEPRHDNDEEVAAKNAAHLAAADPKQPAPFDPEAT